MLRKSFIGFPKERVSLAPYQTFSPDCLLVMGVFLSRYTRSVHLT